VPSGPHKKNNASEENQKIRGEGAVTHDPPADPLRALAYRIMDPNQFVSDTEVTAVRPRTMLKEGLVTEAELRRRWGDFWIIGSVNNSQTEARA
jgi:hypothetical protein